MNKKVVIVDYGLGNLYSISQACQYVGNTPVISSNHDEIINADSLILPGVGAFSKAMERLEEKNLVELIRTFAKSGRPLMGVCLGMQLLFDDSEEFGLHKGLGIIPGSVRKFPKIFNEIHLRIPHIGWNRIFPGENNWEDSPLSQLDKFDFMYFVHSFYADPIDSSFVLSYTYYEGIKYCSSVVKNNVYGFQFHPEKSGDRGLKIYDNFLKL